MARNRRARIAALFMVVGALALVACEGEAVYAGYHWHRESASGEIHFHFSYDTALEDEREWPMIAGLQEWGRSGRARVTVGSTGSCPAGAVCVPITFPSLSGNVLGLAHRGLGPDGHMASGRIEITRYAPPEWWRNIACHEAGHIVGALDHNPNGHEGPCFNGVAGDDELRIITSVYSHGHGTTEPPPASSSVVVK